MALALYHSVMMPTMCCMEDLSGHKRAGEPLGKVEIDPMELLRFISQGWAAMNLMCERAGSSERAIDDRSKAIMHHYHLPFDVPPPH